MQEELLEHINSLEKLPGELVHVAAGKLLQNELEKLSPYRLDQKHERTPEPVNVTANFLEVQNLYAQYLIDG